MQFVPEDAVYVYFRYDEKQTMMIVLNTGDKEKNLFVNRFAEITKGFSKMKNVLDGSIADLKDFKIAAKESLVFELLK